MKSLKFIFLLVLFLPFQHLNAEYSWTKLNVNEPNNAEGYRYNIKFSEDSLGNMYLFLDSALNMSTDDGLTWKNIYSKEGTVYNLVCTSGNTLYFSLMGGQYADESLFYSKDYGKTINPLPCDEPFSRDSTRFGYNLFTKKDTIAVLRITVNKDDTYKRTYNLLYKNGNDGSWKTNQFINFENFKDSFDNCFNIDRKGVIYLTSGNSIYYMNSLDEKPMKMKKIDTNFKIPGIATSIILTDNDNLYQFAQYKLFKLNPTNDLWDTIPVSLSKFDQVFYSRKQFFCLANKSLLSSDDDFKTFKYVKSANRKSNYLHLYVTKKGTLIFQDSVGILWRGVNTSDIKENVMQYDFSLSPNPAADFIEISVGSRHALTNTDIRIFNVFGEMVSTSVCSADTSASGGHRIDVSGLPSGVYFVRVGDKVSKFVKI